MTMIPYVKILPLAQMIRLGRNRDGGYVIYARVLDQTDGLLSYGVGWDIAFEEHFQRRTRKDVHMFDPTMYGEKFMVNFRSLKAAAFRLKLFSAAAYLAKVSVFWWKRKSFATRRLYFIREGIAPLKTLHYDSLKAHIDRLGISGRNSMLKIDIEGDEYALFEDDLTLASLAHFNQIVIEWHDLDTHFAKMETALARIQHQFAVIHVHGNNWGGTFVPAGYPETPGSQDRIPNVLEMTLLRRDCIHPIDLITRPVAYPVQGLDYPNNPREPDYQIEVACPQDEDA